MARVLMGAQAGGEAAVGVQEREASFAWRRQLIEHFCCRADLATWDPYDIWKTRWGLAVKDLYNRRPAGGLIPAAVLTVFDTFVNDRLRWFYSRQEYPIVRALAALTLLNLWRQVRDSGLLEQVLQHLDWLRAHRCTGYSGSGWGLGFAWPASAGLVYGPNTPFSTMTPYALEAFVDYSRATGDREFDALIRSVYDFLERDLYLFEDSEDSVAMSYGPFRDRIVTNASSYAAYCYALLLPYLNAGEAERALYKIQKLYEFVRRMQRQDGSWFYAPREHSFIDCFHSCIILKNLVKTGRMVKLDGCDEMVGAGYDYIKGAFFDPVCRLFRRFSRRNKPGVVRFDLYDNAEVLNLARLCGDEPLTMVLLELIPKHFCDGLNVYSTIDVLGRRRNRNTLRWAVMPFLYALSETL